MSSPLAVCISDIHFNINTLELASQSLLTAMQTARHLNVPLIIAGDLHDTKAILRAEVINRLVSIFTQNVQPVYILVGNHDLINEKGKEHGLNYLGALPNVTVVETPTVYKNITMFPYYSDSKLLEEQIKWVKKARLLVMHQGFQGAFMGDYVQDKTSLHPDVVKDYKVISGHYHKHQTVGTVTYIGNPYTLTFGEANDGPKGFLTLYDDGCFVRNILSLRRHVELDIHINNRKPLQSFTKHDIVKVNLHGPREELDKIGRGEIGSYIGHIPDILKINKVYDKKIVDINKQYNKLPNHDLFDKIIEESNADSSWQMYAKKLWREVNDSKES